MEEITSIQSLFPQSSSAEPAKKPNDLGQQDFLALLVAQLEHQDPAKPMDNFQFLSQIAQFGMVDGIQQLQGSFSSVADSFRQGQMMQATTMLGRQVLSQSNVGILDDKPIEGSIAVPANATNVSLEIRTSDGLTVRSVQMGHVPEGVQDFYWDGTDNGGFAVPRGSYTITAKGEISGTVQDFAVNTLTEVESVTIDAEGSLSLTLATGEQVTLASIEGFK